MNKIRILLVEDRDIIRDCIRILISHTEDVEITQEATDGLEALYYAQNEAFDVILMDYSMPGMNGLEATKQILEINPSIRIIIFSFLNNPYEIREVLAAGAFGYIQKDAENSVYQKAIRTVHQGRRFLCEKSEQLLASLLKAS